MKPNYRSKPVEVFAWRVGVDKPPEGWEICQMRCSSMFMVHPPGWGSPMLVSSGEWWGMVLDGEATLVRDSNGSPEGYEPLEGK